MDPFPFLLRRNRFVAGGGGRGVRFRTTPADPPTDWQRPDPRDAQIVRLKTDIDRLKERLAEADRTIADLTDFHGHVLARIAAQHDEIVRLREIANGTSRVIHLPTNRATLIGPC